MTLHHEHRLDNTIPSGTIGIGETVEIRTKMGAPVAYGEVVSTGPWGVVVAEASGVQNFYQEDFYLFAVHTPEIIKVATNMLSDSSPDSRVAAKLAAMSEAGDPQPSSSGSATPLDKKKKKKDDEEGEDDDDKDDEEGKPSDDKDDEKTDMKPPKPPEQGDKPVATPESSVDVQSLPQDIKDAIISSSQMDADQLNSVLAELSDAAMKGLKRVGVKETELFGLVQRIQNSAYRVLTGVPAPAPKGAKKKRGK